MLTVGLIKELYYLHVVLNANVTSEISLESVGPLKILIQSSVLSLWYRGNFIWKEKLTGPTAFFGVESCDTISRIITCINNNDNAWQSMTYFEKTE